MLHHDTSNPKDAPPREMRGSFRLVQAIGTEQCGTMRHPKHETDRTIGRNQGNSSPSAERAVIAPS